MEKAPSRCTARFAEIRAAARADIGAMAVMMLKLERGLELNATAAGAMMLVQAKLEQVLESSRQRQLKKMEL